MHPLLPAAALHAASALALPGARQPVHLAPYKGIQHSVDAMKRAVLGPRGAWSPEVRFTVEEICRYLTPKDYRSEILAVRYWVADRCPYFRDPVHVEWIRDPVALLEAIKKNGTVRCDCDEVTVLLAALLLAAGAPCEFVTVSFVRGQPPSHVFLRAEVPYADPRNPRSKAWVVVDPVGGTRETTMLPRVVEWQRYSLT